MDKVYLATKQSIKSLKSNSIPICCKVELSKLLYDGENHPLSRVSDQQITLFYLFLCVVLHFYNEVFLIFKQSR